MRYDRLSFFVLDLYRAHLPGKKVNNKEDKGQRSRQKANKIWSELIHSRMAGKRHQLWSWHWTSNTTTSCSISLSEEKELRRDLPGLASVNVFPPALLSVLVFVPSPPRILLDNHCAASSSFLSLFFPFLFARFVQRMKGFWSSSQEKEFFN